MTGADGEGYIFPRLTKRAGIAQLVECKLPKLEVAGSIPVARSKFPFLRGS